MMNLNPSGWLPCTLPRAGFQEALLTCAYASCGREIMHIILQ